MELPEAKWKKQPALPCPCGSGNSYAACCEPIISLHGFGLSKEALAQLNDGELGKAERLYRAHFVMYLSWVHAHTLPMLKSDSLSFPKLVEVDTEALLDNADMVAQCLARLGRAVEIPKWIDNVAVHVPLPGFSKHLTYLRAAWLYVGLDDRDAAQRELKSLGDILQYGRREALELYLDVFGEDLSERKKIEIATEIVKNAAEDDHVRVQYTGLKAISLLQIGEGKLGTDELGGLLRAVPAPSVVSTGDELATTWQLAKAWCLYGNLQDSQEALSNAEKLFQKIPLEMLTAEGRAGFELDLGWLLRDQQRYGEAVDAFRRSFAEDPSAVARIHLLHSLALSGDMEKAREELVEVEKLELQPFYRLEYFAAKASLAIAAENNEMAADVISGLRGLSLDAPFWGRQRDQLIIQTQDFVQRPDSASVETRQSKIIKLLLMVNDVLELKPHLFGVGININKMIEKAAKRVHHK